MLMRGKNKKQPMTHLSNFSPRTNYQVNVTKQLPLSFSNRTTYYYVYYCSLARAPASWWWLSLSSQFKLWPISSTKQQFYTKLTFLGSNNLFPETAHFFDGWLSIWSPQISTFCDQRIANVRSNWTIVGKNSFRHEFRFNWINLRKPLQPFK